MKKQLRGKFLLGLSAVLMSFVMLACISCTKKEPWNYPNVDWYSDNPVMELHTEYSGEPSIGYMEINGQQVQVYLCWGPPTYTFSLYVYNSEDGISVGTDELLLSGKRIGRRIEFGFGWSNSTTASPQGAFCKGLPKGNPYAFDACGSFSQKSCHAIFFGSLVCKAAFCSARQMSIPFRAVPLDFRKET